MRPNRGDLRKAVKSAFDTPRHECALCGFQPFSPASTPTVPNSKCPCCGSSSRHRLIALAATEIGLLANAKQGRVLHFAAEQCLRPLIMRAGPSKYLRADIEPTRGEIVLNIEALDLPHESYDLIICSHVLEHIDDGNALRELFRVLRPSGKLIAMVPTIEGWNATCENDGIRTWKARKAHFGGGTHIRIYGRDFRDRLKSVGFEVSEFCATPGASRPLLADPRGAHLHFHQTLMADHPGPANMLLLAMTRALSWNYEPVAPKAAGHALVLGKGRGP
jgi:SAM-dependent methyltransferase